MLLIVEKGGKQLVAFPFEKEVVSIGRSSECDLSLPFPFVPVHQCEIVRLAQDDYYLHDLSGKGTVLDGRSVRTAKLERGSCLAIEDILIYVQLPENEARSS